MIARITGASITKYADNGQVQARIEWVDGRGKRGSTEGPPKNLHMAELLRRARREKVRVHRQTW